MTPVIRHLQETFVELPLLQVGEDPLKRTFAKKIKKLGPDFYRKVIPLHLVLNLEYSILGQQLRANLLAEKQITKEKLEERLVAALLLAEVLEQVYKYYLNVPREVARLREQKDLYRQILTELKKPILGNTLEPVDVGASFSQQVRNTTINLNLYRLLFIRSKRALDVLALIDLGSEAYRAFVRNLDKYADPFLAHLSWLFFVPRLFVNLFLLIKHTFPHPWMDDKEKALGWSIRFNAQLQRRWFELGNDSVWFTSGILNCFILTGVLAPVGTYLSICFFAYDVVLASIRAYIELNRLDALREQYRDMQSKTKNLEEQQEIAEHLETINKQLNFEILRLGSHVTTTTSIFLAMCCGAPLFAFNPIIPLIGSICLVTICLINFALVQIINHYRPRDMIEVPSGVAKLGFFTKKPEIRVPVTQQTDEPNRELDNSFCCM